MRNTKTNSYPRFELRKIETLKAHPDGVRVADTDAKFHLGKSVEFFNEFGGLLRPLTLNDETNTILDGDLVLNHLRALGIEEVPCWVVCIPVEFEDAAHLALNNHAGEWQWEFVAKRLEELKQQSKKLELTGFPSCKLAALIAVEDWHPKEPTQLDGEASEQVGFGF